MMKNLKTMAAPLTLVIAISSIGCDEAAREATRPPSLAHEQTDLEDVGEKYEEALDATKELVDETKDEFIKRMNAKLRLIDRDIDTLTKVAKKETVEVGGDKTDKVMLDLNSKRLRVKQRMEELGDSSESAWKDLKEGMSDAIEELDQAVEDAGAEFDG